jgi:hypothetical protein
MLLKLLLFFLVTMLKLFPFTNMALPHVADGVNDLKKRRVAVNILDKQSRTADEWLHTWVLLEGLPISRRENQSVMKYYTGK